MKKREFEKLMRECSAGGRLAVCRLLALADDVKSAAVHYLVRNRGPIVKELIPSAFDWSWLHACGYLYTTQGKRYCFVHTCAHQVT